MSPMPPVKLLLSSTLRAYVPGYDASRGIDVEIEGPLSVAELCRRLRVPADRVKMVMVNGTHADLEHVLQGGERVGLFPPVGGG